MVLFILYASLWWLWPIATNSQEDWLREVNALRSQGCRCGTNYFPPAPPVRWNEKLATMAERHSMEMARLNYFSHVSPTGSTLRDRLKQANMGWVGASENLFLARGYHPTSQEVVQSWKKSTSHCQNLLHPTHIEMGVGEYQGYFTQVFIQPKMSN